MEITENKESDFVVKVETRELDDTKIIAQLSIENYTTTRDDFITPYLFYSLYDNDRFQCCCGVCNLKQLGELATEDDLEEEGDDRDELQGEYTSVLASKQFPNQTEAKNWIDQQVKELRNLIKQIKEQREKRKKGFIKGYLNLD